MDGEIHAGAGDLDNAFNTEGYVEAEALVHMLKECGDNLSRENIMAQATHLTKLALPMLEPGITMNTTPDDYVPVKDLRLVRFDGKTWVSFGEAMNGRLSQR